LEGEKMGWQEKIEKYTQKQEETLNLKELKEKEAARIVEEEKLRIIKERNLPLIEQLNKLPVREFLTEIRDDEWKLGEIVVVPEEPKIRLIAKWPRVIPDEHDAPIYEYSGVGDPDDDWSYEVVGYKPRPGWLEFQGEVIEIGVRWEDIVNPKEQVFYSQYDLPSEFYWYHDSRNWWYPSDEVRELFIKSITGYGIYSFTYCPKAWGGDKQPFSLQRNRDRRKEESSLPEKERMVLYGHSVRWYRQPDKIMPHVEYVGHTTPRDRLRYGGYFEYYSGFEGPLIDDPNVVSKLEESLIKSCLIRKEKKLPPPFDRYKKDCELEAIRLVNAGKCRRRFGNISSEEIKKMFT